jgi:DUF971 family protein
MTENLPESSVDVIPVNISRTDHGILIAWNNGERRTYRTAGLRSSCPCATCREKHSAKAADAVKKPMSLPVLSAAEARPLVIEHMRAVGNYAYNIAFSDGHDSGIFTFDYLYSIGEPSSGNGQS